MENETISQEKRQEVLAKVVAAGVRFVNLEFTDVVGMAKCVTIPVDQFADCLVHGKWFDGSALEGFARVAESDMYLYPDVSTFTILPDIALSLSPAGGRAQSNNGPDGVVARVICHVRAPSGEPFDGDPRAALLRALDMARAMGFSFLAAPELEFFLLLEDKPPAPLPHDRGGYFDLSTDLAATVRRQMAQTLQQMGIRIDTSHHEVAAGQHELDFEMGEALYIADSLVTAKYVLKAIAAQHGLYATFMPKPFFGLSGSGMHTHQQLFYRQTGRNAFVDEQGEFGLSEIGRQFIAGQLAHASAMCAILSPLVNSYKRLVHGFEAPVYINWGRVNREALIRVPRPGEDRHATTRIEIRSCDPSCNPYLALAVMLRAGLDGVERKLPLQPAVDESLFLRDETERQRHHTRLLPATLGEALDALRGDALIRDTLGDSIYEGFIEAKSFEWVEYRKQIHPWELERYLPIF